ncbi:MAG: phospholipid carrier-dependent glycosyltransferase [Acidobacteria bacterium]|nr:phospholipid carrier-dependent glycosyltransferase [Acidobacteriota bacterium]MYJ06001.1 phospholipid carrier-dependent glycosyltransferase [Acidobacteriota bacterium]
MRNLAALRRHPHLVALAVVVLVGLWFRAPRVSEGMPYFYHADEAGHFYRAVRMLQNNDYHPYYFLKPTLCFYIRLPAIAGGFLWSAREGEITWIEEIQRSDENDPTGILWTASHPRIVMWARAVGTFFSLVMILATYGITRRVVASPWPAVLAALLVACVPFLITESSRIAVDTLMAAFCLLCVWLSLRVMENPTAGRAALAGLAAGLAVTSKYNGLPIVAAPLLACALSGRCNLRTVIAALGLSAVGFLIGTPYALLAVSDFLNGMATEIIHYGILGHVGATVEPGWEHAQRYLGRMSRAGGGFVLTYAGIVGAAVMLATRWRAALVILAFPVGFLTLMLGQRVFAFSNMLVTPPFFAIAAACAVQLVLQYRARLPRAAGLALAPACVVALAAQPAIRALDERRSAVATESRHLASAWLLDQTEPAPETAMAVELRLPQANYRVPSVSPARTEQLMDPVQLFLEGYDRLVVGPEFDHAEGNQEARALMQVQRVFEGETYPQPIPRSPQVTVFELPSLLANTRPVRARVESEPQYEVVKGIVRSRVARLPLDPSTATGSSVGQGGDVTLTLDVSTPWTSQSCHFELPGWQSRDLCEGLAPDQPETRTVEVPAEALAGQEQIWVFVSHVRRDPESGVGGETQRIGLRVAVRSVSPAA